MSQLLAIGDDPKVRALLRRIPTGAGCLVREVGCLVREAGPWCGRGFPGAGGGSLKSARRFGATAKLPKPIDPETLLRAAREALAPPDMVALGAS